MGLFSKKNSGDTFSGNPAQAGVAQTQMSARKARRMSKLKEKLDMYDMIIANIAAGKSIIEPVVRLDNSQLSIGFSNIASEDQITKYFILSKLPDFMQERFLDTIREECLNKGIKINFFIYGQPHHINWDSQEMKNRMNVWKRYSEEHSGPVDVFEYRNQRSEAVARQRIILSTRYLNESELDYHRSLVKVTFLITVTARRTEKDIVNMLDSITRLKALCKGKDIRLQELRINMIDWIRAFSPFCLARDKSVISKISKQVMTDDILANFNSYKQGCIGNAGVPLGIDVLNGGPVLNIFKENPSAADNWLISAGTGGGKSYWVKTLLTYLYAAGFVISIMDYEGDEYTNMAKFIAGGVEDEVKIVSMGKGSTVYFDPCEIPDITGDDEVDSDLKDSAFNFIMAIFRTIVHEKGENFTKEEERVMSTAIQRVYDSRGVTDDKNTWHRSKGLRLHDVYHEIKSIVESKELADSDAGNLKHMAAINIADASMVYFEPGEVKSSTFLNPMSANELYKAKFIIFSFGMKGADQSSIDTTILALKQLSVAYINIQISNYCKYVRKCFNVKIWEEFQRWGSIGGNSVGSSSNIIINTITGGRKRGDVNFIITNDLGALLDDSNKTNKTLSQNIQNYAIGAIKDSSIRRSFCEKFDQWDILPSLDNVAKATISADGKGKAHSNSRYSYAFCIVMGSGKKAIVRAELPVALRKSKLFYTGIEVKNDEDNDEQ